MNIMDKLTNDDILTGKAEIDYSLMSVDEIQNIARYNLPRLTKIQAEFCHEVVAQNFGPLLDVANKLYGEKHKERAFKKAVKMSQSGKVTLWLRIMKARVILRSNCSGIDVMQVLGLIMKSEDTQASTRVQAAKILGGFLGLGVNTKGKQPVDDNIPFSMEVTEDE